MSFSKFINNTKNLEFNRFGITATTLCIQSCLGSISSCYILQMNANHNLIPLTFVSIFTMGANAIAIAQAHMKYVIYGFIVSAVISIITGGYALYNL